MRTTVMMCSVLLLSLAILSGCYAYTYEPPPPAPSGPPSGYIGPPQP